MIDEPGSVNALPPHVSDLVWMVAITNVQAERRAASAIDREGLVPYCPMEVRPVVRHHRKTVAVKPLLPRYLFVGFEPDRQGPHQLRSLDGVEGLVRFDGLAVSVPAIVVKELAAREIAGEFAAEAAEANRRGPPLFRTGQTVKAVHGPFLGVYGHIVRCFKNGHVDVLLSLFGRQTRTRFREQDLKTV